MDFIRLSNDFVTCVKRYGKIIISEHFLPPEEKTIKPKNMGGVIGGEKVRRQERGRTPTVQHSLFFKPLLLLYFIYEACSKLKHSHLESYSCCAWLRLVSA